MEDFYFGSVKTKGFGEPLQADMKGLRGRSLGRHGGLLLCAFSGPVGHRRITHHPKIWTSLTRP